jgi:transcription elongation factor Elf1
MALPKLDSPTYELSVPSTGAKIPYRPYLVKEEKILMMALESNDERQMIRAIRDVILACTDNNIDMNNVAMFDMEYIFTQLRSKSVGESAEIGIKCSECESTNEVSVNLENVRVDSPKDVSDTIELTDTVGVKMKYPSVNTVLYSTNSGTSSNIERIFDLLVNCIDSIYSGDQIFDVSSQSKEEINEFIESLNGEQFAKVRKFIENIPSTQIDVEFTCKDCSHKNNVNLKGLANFFG